MENPGMTNMEASSGVRTPRRVLLDLVPVRTRIEIGITFLALGLLAFVVAELVKNISSWQVAAPAAVGLLFSWYLAQSTLKAKHAWFLLVGTWLVYAGLFNLRLLRPIIDVLAGIRVFGLNVLSWASDIENSSIPDVGPLGQTIQDLVSSTGSAALRIFAWVGALAAGTEAFDPLVNELVWTTVAWLVAAWAGWFIRRKEHPLLAMVPSGALLAGISNYTNYHFYPLVLFLGIALILVLAIKLNSQERSWEKCGIDYPSEIRLDVGMSAAPILFLILAAAAVVPSISIRNMIQSVRELVEKPTTTMGENLGLHREAPVAFSPSGWNPGGLPRSHLLGSGPELAEIPALWIKTGELAPADPNETEGQEVPRYYWRSLTFERYTGKGWLNGEIEAIRYPKGEKARFSEFGHTETWDPPPGYRLVQQEIKVFSTGLDVLYSSGSLVSVDEDYTVAWRSPRSKAMGEPGGGDIFGAIIEKKNYKVQSLVPETSPSELRLSGSEYPAWIADRYLSLPPSIPRRVYTLAFDLTATIANRYDRALAIEQYLRSLPYSLEVPLPPEDRDVVDYYLFDLQSGYCDYAASAMVILARAAGLPARLVMGYAPGSYNFSEAQYEISEADAHSWAEIYFPGAGWVAFEPTGSLPEIHTSTGTEGTEGWPAVRGFNLPIQTQRALIQIARMIALLVGFPLLMILSWWGIDHWRLGRLSPLGAVLSVYRRLYLQGQIFKRTAGVVKQGDTPYEFAASLESHLINLPFRQWQIKLMAPAGQEIETLANLYAFASYSPRPVEKEDADLAIRLWEALRLRLWLARVMVKKKNRN
jgi:transglutaminase-like putative cysteine protease